MTLNPNPELYVDYLNHGPKPEGHLKLNPKHSTLKPKSYVDPLKPDLNSSPKPKPPALNPKVGAQDPDL